MGSMQYNTTGTGNTAIGINALTSNIVGDNNTAYGRGTLIYNKSNNNTAFGSLSLWSNTTGTNNTAIGYNAFSLGSDYENSTSIGANSNVTGSNQVQLGDSSTTSYVYGTVQNRSDQRDKTDIRDTILGLDFINKLRPVDFKWDYREDYCEIVKVDESTQIIQNNKDGSKTRNRFHHGLIAQEVQKVINDTNIDFGGFQDHKMNGGNDILSIGYDELIGPLIKAVQELTTQVNNLKKENERFKYQLNIN